MHWAAAPHARSDSLDLRDCRCGAHKPAKGKKMAGDARSSLVRQKKKQKFPTLGRKNKS